MFDWIDIEVALSNITNIFRVFVEKVSDVLRNFFMIQYVQNISTIFEVL